MRNKGMLGFSEIKHGTKNAPGLYKCFRLDIAHWMICHQIFRVLVLQGFGCCCHQNLIPTDVKSRLMRHIS